MGRRCQAYFLVIHRAVTPVALQSPSGRMRTALILPARISCAAAIILPKSVSTMFEQKRRLEMEGQDSEASPAFAIDQAEIVASTAPLRNGKEVAQKFDPITTDWTYIRWLRDRKGIEKILREQPFWCPRTWPAEYPAPPTIVRCRTRKEMRRHSAK